MNDSGREEQLHAAAGLLDDPLPTPNATNFVGRMRGEAQSHLLEADDGNFYVVKFRNNPQHRRVLVNELLCSSLLDQLGILSPETSPVNVSDSFLESHPEVHLKFGDKRIPVEPGLHFGSRYVGVPGRTVVYNFLPKALLSQVANLDHFRAVLAFDKWVGNIDGRQAVFTRVMFEGESHDPESLRERFIALMIDHGHAFECGDWRFRDSPLRGFYGRDSVYDSVRSLDDFEPWLEWIRDFPQEEIELAAKRIPPEWVAGEEGELDRMLDQLYQRRARVPELISDCRNGTSNPFRNWAIKKDPRSETSWAADVTGGTPRLRKCGTLV